MMSLRWCHYVWSMVSCRRRANGRVQKPKKHTHTHTHTHKTSDDRSAHGPRGAFTAQSRRYVFIETSIKYYRFNRPRWWRRFRVTTPRHATCGPGSFVFCFCLFCLFCFFMPLLLLLLLWWWWWCFSLRGRRYLVLPCYRVSIDSFNNSFVFCLFFFLCCR